MFSNFIVTFRETLEAALVVGIILGYLTRIKQAQYNNVVYLGVVFGIATSVAGAFLFNALAGGFDGAAEQIFEGTTMLVGAFLLTTMIMWMMNQKHVAEHLEHRVEAELSHAHKFGLFSLVLVSVLREGIETVIFLSAASFLAGGSHITGALAGIIFAMLLGYGIFVGLFGYNGNPSLLEVVGYFLYLIVILVWWRMADKNKRLD